MALSFKVRMCKHLGVSALTGKIVKWDNYCAIKEHHLFCNHLSGFHDFFHTSQQQQWLQRYLKGESFNQQRAPSF